MIKPINPELQNLIDEHEGLCKQIITLSDQILQEKPLLLPDEGWDFKNMQLSVMSLYRDILGKRIKLLW